MTGQIIDDADCEFCTRSARWIDDRPLAWQSLDLASVGASQEQADNFVGWLEHAGSGRPLRSGLPPAQ